MIFPYITTNPCFWQGFGYFEKLELLDLQEVELDWCLATEE